MLVQLMSGMWDFAAFSDLSATLQGMAVTLEKKRVKRACGSGLKTRETVKLYALSASITEEVTLGSHRTLNYMLYKLMATRCYEILLRK